MKPLWCLPIVLLLAPLPVSALDPGTADGVIEVNKQTFTLDHAYALLHDNAEGLLDRPNELRIVITDRAVPPDALYGVAFLPVEEMAKEGTVHGLLLLLDPDHRNDVTVTVLYPPPLPGQSLLTEPLAATGEDALKALNIGPDSVTGEFRHRERQDLAFMDIPRLVYRAKFDAPLLHEPAVTADLRGQAALDSPQVKVLRAKVTALANGDFATLKRISTARANRRSKAFLVQAGGEGINLAKQAAADMARSLQNIQRVVVRGRHAVVIFTDKQWMNFVEEGGTWKSDD